MTDDLVPLLTVPTPPGPSQDVRWRQGTVVTFNQDTLENSVDIGGTVLVNLPVLGVAEATTLKTGSVVGLLAIESTLGSVTYAILGRLVTPATPAATEAVSLLSSWIGAASVAVQETCTSLTFTDLATPGPVVTVNVRASGRVVLLVTCQMQSIDLSPANGMGGFVTLTLDGANVWTTATTEVNLQLVRFSGPIGGITSNSDYTTITQSLVLEGLNPGSTTFKMKYRVHNAGDYMDYGRRSIVALTL